MTYWNSLAPYMRRYTIRILLFMASYVVILPSSLAFARGGADHSQATLIGLALVTALPIIGVFWAIFRLLVKPTMNINGCCLPNRRCSLPPSRW
jgi:hypothetical protein